MAFDTHSWPILKQSQINSVNLVVLPNLLFFFLVWWRQVSPTSLECLEQCMCIMHNLIAASDTIYKLRLLRLMYICSAMTLCLCNLWDMLVTVIMSHIKCQQTLQLHLYTLTNWQFLYKLTCFFEYVLCCYMHSFPLLQ